MNMGVRLSRWFKLGSRKQVTPQKQEAGPVGPPLRLQVAHEHGFLPAVLEVQETPPSPMGRGIIWALLLFCTVALAWSFLPIDITAVAQGKIVPSGQVKVIQPYETGIVRVIHVAEGDTVSAGQVLIELDPVVSQAELLRLETELQQAQANSARFTQQGALHGSLEAKAGIEVSPLMARQQTLLVSQDAEYRAKALALDREIERGRAAVAGSGEVVKKLEQTLPLITERAANYAKLAEAGHVPKVEALVIEEQRIVQQQDLAGERYKRVEAAAAVAQAQAQKASMVAEYRRIALEQLNQEQRKVAELEQEVIKARERKNWQRLTSPVNGIAQQLKVHTVGGVVTPAQELLTIVPEGRQVEIEAYLPNKDIGFVFPGQAARVKVETFPFTRYGTVDAMIVDVSDDAIADPDLGLVYKVRGFLKAEHIRVDGRFIKLTPGMAVTAEIKTGKRRILEYFLSPVLRYKDESIKER